MKNWITRLRIALATAIAPPGTLVVSPLVSRPLPRADIAPTPARSPEKLASPVLMILRCKDPFMWYANKVGDYVPYCGTWPEGFKSREDDGHSNIVKFEDAKIVHLP
ncbi:hypothetical protein UFOVP1544_15 [uncultured Caudovirales phage]|uniref:Uncharacterized protein n=1 Tax=uncultured Caudovirales phage TaxID=2100421 RepID=A0A6J7XCZ2_9CAUD|nr:hypothetical protein UFOVP1544_15 [uncultured Caudovirales phage]